MLKLLKLLISYICCQPPNSNQKDERLALDDARLVNENMLKTCDPNLNFHLTSLAKPNWPKSAPTIPNMFYKNLNEKVRKINNMF